MPNPELTRGELALGQSHPAAFDAQVWISKQTPEKLAMWQESFASCAIEGNLLAEVCSETLRRLLNSEPVSDRYLLGLAWTMRSGDWPEPIEKREGDPLTKDAVGDTDVEAVEEAVGMGCGAWDQVDPREIIAASWNLTLNRPTP